MVSTIQEMTACVHVCSNSIIQRRACELHNVHVHVHVTIQDLHIQLYINIHVHCMIGTQVCGFEDRIVSTCVCTCRYLNISYLLVS